MDINNSKFPAALNEIKQMLEEHAAEEEKNEWSVIERELSSEIDTVNSTINTVKKTVPTRPHPSAPIKPSHGSVLVGPVAALLDKLRDVRREFPKTDPINPN